MMNLPAVAGPTLRLTKTRVSRTMLLSKSIAPVALLLAASAIIGCGDTDGGGTGALPLGGALEPGEEIFAVSSVVINPGSGDRTTFVQATRSLGGTFDLSTGVETAGNAVVYARGPFLYVGEAELPVWQRYVVDEQDRLVKDERLSLGNYGDTRVGFGNVIVDAERAVSIIDSQGIAVVWNPTTMTIVGEVDLGLTRPGFTLETWTTVAHDGLVYVPARWGNLVTGEVVRNLTVAIIDPYTLTLVGTAEDDRCASGGHMVFDEAGYGYLMGDGRNYGTHMIENAGGAEADDNCILRIPPGGTDFEEDFYVSVPSLADGRQTSTEFETARVDSGVAFAKVFYEEELPSNVEPVDFGLWDEPAHRLWRFDLGAQVTAAPVDGLPLTAVGFSGSGVDGFVYTGEPINQGPTSDVYEVDPNTNQARLAFVVEGFFNRLVSLRGE